MRKLNGIDKNVKSLQRDDYMGLPVTRVSC